jgi:ADP-ribosylglycohydrolase
VSADLDGRRARALHSLDGLSVGDAFGERLFFDQDAIDERREPPGRWRTTDDTEMAVAIVDVLRREGRIAEEALARAFARRYQADPYRGYGPGASAVLSQIGAGLPWHEAARAAFGGAGSMGNGAAMRVAPLGAYFADDLSVVADEARRSAVVTHAHDDGQAGAIAVAIATACAVQAGRDLDAAVFFATVLTWTPAGPTQAGIEKASRLSLESTPVEAALELGAGWKTICADTVPFCLWIVAREASDYVEALWQTASVPADRDTNCAIVGGIMAALTGPEGIPASWLAAREPLRHDVDLGPSR